MREAAGITKHCERLKMRLLSYVLPGDAISADSLLQAS